MRVSISYKHLKHSPALDQRIKNKCHRLEKYFDGKIDLKWVCSRHEGIGQADLILHGPRFHYRASATDRNLYRAFDYVLDKIERQIEKKKDRVKDHIHHKHEDMEVKFFDMEEAWEDYDETHFDDLDRFN
jgi:putative sigma-54 modulation protein